MRRRTFFAVALLAAVLIAGVASYYASSDPDGLNYVAEQHGFNDKEKESKASDSPLAGYETSGVDDDRVSGGLAGVAGLVLVLGIGGGLFWVIRRRDGADAPPSEG